MRDFFEIYVDGHWKYFHKNGYCHGTLCRWKYTDGTPRPKSLWFFCLEISKFWNVEHHDIMLEAIRNIKGDSCRNLINRRHVSVQKLKKSAKKENQKNKP